MKEEGANIRKDVPSEGSSAAAPCKACSAFKSWAKEQKSIYDEQIQKQMRSAAECPLDKDELGSATWSFLHTMAAYYPQQPTEQQQKEMRCFFNIFAKYYPCKPCADDLRIQLKDLPPDVSSDVNLSNWLCQIHNQVNEKLGKPLFDCDRVMERWRDGWKDGSCD